VGYRSCLKRLATVKLHEVSNLPPPYKQAPSKIPDAFTAFGTFVNPNHFSLQAKGRKCLRHLQVEEWKQELSAVMAQTGETTTAQQQQERPLLCLPELEFMLLLLLWTRKP
jgi:hypothetical protein